jgi:hypothetical protein
MQIDLLKQILAREAFREPAEPLQHFTLIETDALASLKEIKITHLGKKSLILLPDKGQGNDKRYSQLLSKQNKYHHNKACDAVILYSTEENKHYTVLCELKSSQPQGCADQFRATLCFLKYIEDILIEFCECNSMNRQIRCVVFNTKSFSYGTLNKLPVSRGRWSHISKIIKFIKVKEGESKGISELL